MHRIVDLLLALLLIIVSAPLWILVILTLLLFSPGNPFFTHERVGRNGAPFLLVKFRTMRSAGRPGSELTVSGDARVTRIGRVLRRFKLDEIPQLLNILAGDMTFVGPRPESPAYVKHYSAAQRQVLDYLPGLTDPASLKYRHEEQVLASYADPERAYLERILPDKLKLSLEYQKNRGLLSDIKIMGATVAAIFRRHHDSAGKRQT